MQEVNCFDKNQYVNVINTKIDNDTISDVW